jgi:hypothetical protein
VTGKGVVSARGLACDARGLGSSMQDRTAVSNPFIQSSTHTHSLTRLQLLGCNRHVDWLAVGVMVLLMVVLGGSCRRGSCGGCSACICSGCCCCCIRGLHVLASEHMVT